MLSQDESDLWYRAGIQMLAVLTAVIMLFALAQWEDAQGASIESKVKWGPWSHQLPGIAVFGMPVPADWRFERTYVRSTVDAPHTKCVAFAQRESLSDPWTYQFAMGFEPEWLENMNIYEAVWKSCTEDPPSQ